MPERAGTDERFQGAAEYLQRTRGLFAAGAA